jgi:hypothetical protein
VTIRAAGFRHFLFVIWGKSDRGCISMVHHGPANVTPGLDFRRLRSILTRLKAAVQRQNNENSHHIRRKSVDSVIVSDTVRVYEFPDFIYGFASF